MGPEETRGIKPVIRGRDIGKGLLELISRFEKRAFSLPEMVVALKNIQATITNKNVIKIWLKL